jgi:hypothetical protein
MGSRFFVIILSLLPVALLTCACVPAVDVEAEKAEVESVVELYFHMFRSGDPELLPHVMVQDDPKLFVLGTDADERYLGWEQNKSRFDRLFDTINFRSIRLADLTINIAPSGKIAWFSVVSDWEIVTPTEEIKLRGIRSTGVLEKRGLEWRIVQYHASAPYQGQVVEY